MNTSTVAVLLFFAAGAALWLVVMIGWVALRRRRMMPGEWQFCVFGILASTWGLNLILVHYLFFMFTVGGTAWGGKVEDGRYFVGRVGEFTQVSRALYWTSWWHTVLTLGIPFVLTPLVRLGRLVRRLLVPNASGAEPRRRA